MKNTIASHRSTSYSRSSESESDLTDRERIAEAAFHGRNVVGEWDPLPLAPDAVNISSMQASRSIFSRGT
jgi:hypothetical protein